MANFNKVMLLGNLTRDPELKYLPSQTPVCELGLAVNRRWTAADGQQKDETTFVDCNAFGKQAETLAKYVKKGNPLFIEGRLKYDQWEAQDGSKRSKLRVVIENFQFISTGQRTGGAAPTDAEGGTETNSGYTPRPASPQRQPFRPQGRPAAGPTAPPPEMDAPPNYDDAPQIREDDIPF